MRKSGSSLATLSAVLVFASLVGCSASSSRDNSISAGAGAGSGGPGGSGAGPFGGAGGSGPAGGAGGGGGIAIPDGGGGDARECGGETFPLERKPAKVLLVLDRSGSMEEPPEGSTTGDSKWVVTVPALNQVITDTSAQIQWALKVFPEGDTYCAVTDAIDVQFAQQNGAAVTGKISTTTPKGNGTPTGDAMKAAVKYLKQLEAAGDTDQKYILLATDGEPSCVGGSETSQETARPYAVTAVTEAATAGYHTYVIGVSTTKANARQALNDMAIAGQEARPDPNPLATKFYLANTRDELVAAMSAITGNVLDCRFSLSTPPPDGEHVGVRVGDEVVPADSWDFTGSDKRTVEVTGAFCDRIKGGQASAVRIVFGCPQDPVK